jgi:tetratricopeptide (TPR) repeat protein
VTTLPAQTEFSWSSVVQECLTRIGDIANRVLHLAASAIEPVPRSWLGDDANTADTSKLIQYGLARTVQWKGLSSVAVHPVLRAHNPTIEIGQFRALSNATPEPALVDLLLNLGMYEDAADDISTLVELWLPTSEAPPSLVDWVERLPHEIASRHPMVLIGLARALALRAEAGDLTRATAAIEELLSHSITEGQRWQVLRMGADVAIRSLDYARATAFVEAAEHLLQRSAGSFDAQALGVLRSRIHWEQCEFDDARSALGSGLGSDQVEDARHSSWLGRASASLGDFATAARVVNQGIEQSRRSRSLRPEAYNAVLLAEYELVRGNLGRARRLAERSSYIADDRGLTNLRAQALGVQAEVASAQGLAKEGDRLLEMANNAVTERGDDAWANAYLLVVQARLARFQPKWAYLWSLAERIESEAVVLGRRAEHHPVVGALLIESAHCWAGSGYSHHARQLLGQLSQRRVDWRTSCERQLIDLVTSPELDDDERHQGVAALIQRARAAGAPYLAATWAYLASTYRLVNGDESTAETYGAWVAEVAEVRGWPILASKARAFAPRSYVSAERGHLVQHSDGTTTFVAPRRRQRSARTDPDVPLPDPFYE